LGDAFAILRAGGEPVARAEPDDESEAGCGELRCHLFRPEVGEPGFNGKSGGGVLHAEPVCRQHLLEPDLRTGGRRFYRNAAQRGPERVETGGFRTAVLARGKMGIELCAGAGIEIAGPAVGKAFVGILAIHKEAFLPGLESWKKISLSWRTARNTRCLTVPT